jgi:hypothetical protein
MSKKREKEKEKEYNLLPPSKQFNENSITSKSKKITVDSILKNQKKSQETTTEEEIIIKVHRPHLTEKTPLEAIKSVIYYPLTIIQIGILVWILGFNYQGLISEYTYFRGGTTDCSLYYDFAYNFSRYYYFFFAIFNIIDVGISFYFEEVSLSSLTFYSNICASIINFFWLILGLIVFLPNANKLGISGNGNIAQDARFCGFASTINDVNTNCAQFNPSMLPLCDSLTNVIAFSNLNIHPNFIMIMCALGALIILGVLKVFCAKETKLIVEKVGDKYINELDPLKISGITSSVKKNGLFGSKLKGTVQPLAKNVIMEEETSYFTFITDSYILSYVPIEFLDIASGLLLAIWLGWFQQNTNTVKPSFKVDSVILVACTTFSVEYVSIVNYIFYALIAFLIPVWCFNRKLLTLYHNRWATVSSFIGMCISFSLFVWVIIDLFGCNGNGNGANICNSKLFCAAFDIIGPFFNNPANKCPNIFSCPQMIPSSELSPSNDYLVLLSFTIVWIINNLAVFIYSIKVESLLSPHKETEPKRVKLI